MVETTATIVAAIIGATVSASSEIANEATKGGSHVYGVISNESSINFETVALGPVHGHHSVHMDSSLEGSAWVEEQFRLAVVGEFGEDYTPEEEAKKRGEWISNFIFEKYAKQCCVKFGGEGDNMGYESLFILKNEQHRILIGLLFRKIPGGKYGAGAILGAWPKNLITNQWIDDPIESLGSTGNQFIDQIKKYDIALYDYYKQRQSMGRISETNKSNDTIAFSESRSFSIGKKNTTKFNLIIDVSSPGEKIGVKIKDFS